MSRRLEILPVGWYYAVIRLSKEFCHEKMNQMMVNVSNFGIIINKQSFHRGFQHQNSLIPLWNKYVSMQVMNRRYSLKIYKQMIL